MIDRQLKQRILKLVGHFPAVAILGARQVGKTTLAKMLMPELPKQNLYLDLENPADLAKLENVLAFLNANQEKCIIIDEVQRISSLNIQVTNNETNKFFKSCKRIAIFSRDDRIRNCRGYKDVSLGSC
jgi:predicted AAA+ superfamily ATPase